MVRVVLAPGLLVHLRKSVIDGIQLQDLTIRDSSLNELIQRYYSSGKVTLWGFKEALKGLWSEVERGDYVLFYHAGEFPYVGKILFLISP